MVTHSSLDGKKVKFSRIKLKLMAECNFTVRNGLRQDFHVRKAWQSLLPNHVVM